MARSPFRDRTTERRNRVMMLARYPLVLAMLAAIALDAFWAAWVIFAAWYGAWLIWVARVFKD